MHRYQVALLGREPALAAGLRDQIYDTAAELGLERAHLCILGEAEIDSRDRKSPLVAVFFGYQGASDSDHPAVSAIHADSLPIIPAVPTLDGFRGQVPVTIAGVNGLALANEGDLTRLVTAIFENLHLLRLERRLFISYRRAESTPIAMQLYEALDERGFDVFLDTRSVAPAVDVQAELWHRLADSDVVILLDTPNFRVSDWTVQELAQANATSIQILHLLWPGVPAVQPERFVSLQKGGEMHAVFPAVGVPTAPRLEEFEEAVRDFDPAPVVRVIYDERGILDRWKIHLGWLSSHLPVKAIQVSNLPDAFAAGDI